ncbi:MAG: hypothetical protein ACTSQW_08360, partial [Promethearchaeota archaeon]
IKLNAAEKNLINRIHGIMNKKNVNRFYVSYLMSDKQEFNIRTADIILNLIQKKVFQPII